MMLATIDFWIWVIIFVAVAISKLWSQLQPPANEEEPTESAPPEPPPKLPAARQIKRGPPAAPPPPIQEQWGEAPKTLRDFLEQVRQQTEPRVTPPKPSPAPVPVAKPVKPAPAPVPAEALKPTPAALVERKPTRATRWAEALRDRANLRNIIIGAEVIGPPKGVQ